MLKAISTVFWRDYLYFKKRFLSITIGSLLSPFLYILAFGYGLGRNVHMEGESYLVFLIPGILAITTMNTSFNSIATPLTLARLHEGTLANYILAPVSSCTFVAGKICAGALRGMYAALLIMLFTLFAVPEIRFSFIFFVLLLLNALVFSSLGFVIAMVIGSHLDMARVKTFFITPMVFVCGTFFSLNALPGWLKGILFFLPLTPASQGLRGVARGDGVSWESLIIQIVYFVLFFGAGLYFYNKGE